jgi:hypothetical protein
VTAIDIDLGAAPLVVTFDFATDSASVVRASAPAAAPQPTPDVENRSEAVMDVSGTAQDIVAAYGEALSRLADH